MSDVVRRECDCGPVGVGGGVDHYLELNYLADDIAVLHARRAESVDDESYRGVVFDSADGSWHDAGDAVFRNVDLSGSRFTGSLSSLTFESCVLTNVDLSGLQVDLVVLRDCEGFPLVDANLRGVDTVYSERSDGEGRVCTHYCVHGDDGSSGSPYAVVFPSDARAVMAFEVWHECGLQHDRVLRGEGELRDAVALYCVSDADLDARVHDYSRAIDWDSGYWRDTTIPVVVSSLPDCMHHMIDHHCYGDDVVDAS